METYVIQFYFKIDDDWREALVITKADSTEEAKEKLKKDPYFNNREMEISFVTCFSNKDLKENVWLIYERT